MGSAAIRGQADKARNRTLQTSIATVFFMVTLLSIISICLKTRFARNNQKQIVEWYLQDKIQAKFCSSIKKRSNPQVFVATGRFF
jgi:hypothetical protein